MWPSSRFTSLPRGYSSHWALASRKVEFTATEYALLRLLSQQAGCVLTNDRVLRAGWGKRGADDPDAVDAYVSKLGYRLGDGAASAAWIFTTRGVCYRMPEPESGGGP